MDKSKPDWLRKEEKEQRMASKHKPKPKLTMTQLKAIKDREIMEAFKNFIRTGTSEYNCYIIMGQGNNNELTYLASHAKQACVDKNIAWQCSKDFLLDRYPNADVKAFQAGFSYHYDMAEKNPRYRKACFE